MHRTISHTTSLVKQSAFEHLADIRHPILQSKGLVNLPSAECEGLIASLSPNPPDHIGTGESAGHPP